MEQLKNFAMGRLNSIDHLEDAVDKAALYHQVFGACELYASFGEKQMQEAKEIWQDFSCKYYEKIYGQ